MKNPNISKHPCAGKCSNFKDEQCKTCLVQELPSHKCCDVDFLPGDVVVLTEPFYSNFTDELFEVREFNSNLQWYGIESENHYFHVEASEIRCASIAEIQANRRLTDAELSQAEVS